MKKYILAQTGRCINLEDEIKNIAEAVFDGVFLTINQQDLHSNDIKLIRTFGLDIETLHLPYNRPFNLINSLWETGNAEQAKLILKKGIMLASRNNIQAVVLHASSGYNPPSITDNAIDNFIDIAKYCKSLDVKLTIENIKSMEHLRGLMNVLSLEDVKLCFDLGHANAFTHNLYTDEWNDFLNKVYCMHVHDNDGVNDLHLIPGMGNIKYREILEKILSYNNSINLTLEIYYAGREKFYGEKTISDFYREAYKAAQKLNL